jgi:hypothetical protein
MKRHGGADVFVTGKLCSYGAATLIAKKPGAD